LADFSLELKCDPNRTITFSAGKDTLAIQLRGFSGAVGFFGAAAA
jgi:hypothetical protein